MAQDEHICNGQLNDNVHTLEDVDPYRLRQDIVQQPLATWTRNDFLQYACQLTLNPITAHRNLHLQQENRIAVYHRESRQQCPEQPEQFDCCYQVLCTNGLTGRCYWEVQWNGKGVNVALAYKSINRRGKGNDSRFGYNKMSWSLHCTSTRYSFWHNAVETEVPGRDYFKIGVFLDHEAGTLSFYSVSETMTLIHRIQTTFTEPLYPGFKLSYPNGYIKI